MFGLKKKDSTYIFLMIIFFQYLFLGALLIFPKEKNVINQVFIENNNSIDNEEHSSTKDQIDSKLLQIIEPLSAKDDVKVLITVEQPKLNNVILQIQKYGIVEKILNYTDFSGFSAAIKKGILQSVLLDLPHGIDYIEYNGQAEKTLKDSLEELRIFPYIRNNYSLKGDENTSIAILDAGLDPTHPALKDKIIYWHDYLSTNFSSAVDYRGHGTAIGSIAAGNPYNTTDNEGRTLISERDYYKWPGLEPDDYRYVTNAIKADVNGTLIIECNWFKNNSNINMINFTLFNSNNQSVAEINTPNPNEIYNLTYEINETNYGIYSIVHYFTLTAVGGEEYGINLTIHLPEKNDEFENSYSGVAPNCKIVALRCLQEEVGDLANIIAAMNWILNTTNKEKYNITAVIMSFKINSLTVRDLADDLVEAGLIVSCAAGNDGPGFNYAGSDANAPGSADKVISVGATNHNFSITDYSSQGGYNKYNHVIKPDIVAPGGVRNDWSYMNTPIYCADSNDNEYLGSNYPSTYEDMKDVIANDTLGVSGTSFSAPFVAGAGQLIIQALGGRQNWNYSESEALFVKNLLLLTATETFPNYRLNIIDQYRTQFSPTLDRGEKDVHEGYGKINPDVAIDAVMNEISINSTLNGTLYSILTNQEYEPYCWARKVYLPRDFYNITLEVPQTADFDLYIYDYQGNQYGEPIIIQKGINDTLGIDEVFIDFASYVDDYYFIVVKAVNGSGQFNLSLYKSPTYFDKIAPICNILLPLNNSYLNETILIRGNATDNQAVASVRIIINTPTRQVTFDISTPSTQFEISWTSLKMDNGNCTIYIIAYDYFYNLNYSETRYIVIFNDNVPPIIVWISPKDYSTITGPVLIKAYITDQHSQVSNATLMIETVKRKCTIFQETKGPFQYYFYPNLDEDGSCYIKIEAYDTKNNLGKSITIALLLRVGQLFSNAIIFSLILTLGSMIVMNKVAKKLIVNEKYIQMLENIQNYIKKPTKENLSKVQIKRLFKKELPIVSRINEINTLINEKRYSSALVLCDEILKKDVKLKRNRMSDELFTLLNDIKKDLLDKIKKLG